MLSGKSLGGGIAYVGVLCNGTHGYGVSASLSGNFNIDNPSVVWDLLVVSHEMRFAREAADRVVFMDDGQVVEQGAPQTLFAAPREPRTREFLALVGDAA